jgi:BirA family biotin operon repressor/biotin-[acetyl-CoA-carboxylase] ligase
VQSTNDLAISLVKNRNIFANEIILANQQSKGRGRYNRQWISEIGNLYFSLVLDGKIANKNLGLNQISTLSLVANIALNLTIKTISQAQNIEINIANKWPNDLLIENKKVAGILLENIIINNNCEFIILGIGVNINNNPQNTLFQATNLQQLKITINAKILLENFLENFNNFFEIWQNFGFKNLRDLWLKDAYNFHKEIVVGDSDSRINGIFEDLDEFGNLILKTPQKTIKIFAGDILNP